MPTAELPRPPRRAGPPRRVPLRREDFRDGPYVASEPDVELILMEDVDFNFPDPPPPASSPHHLGFFAGLVIGAPRVIVNLNGRTLRMHPNYRPRQRFFSLISLDVTPFPVGKARFDTLPVRPTDVTIRNGSLGLTSHFCVHGNTLREGRVLISDVRMDDFEVGAVSISGASDVHIRRCKVGAAVPPTTSSDVNMLVDLAKVLRARGAEEDAAAMMALASHRSRQMTASDAIVRSIVVMPEFNVQGVPDAFGTRISRVAVVDCTFDDLRAEPVEVVGISTREGSVEALKDANGNLIAMDDARAGSLLSRLQASFNAESLPRSAREALMRGPSSAFHPVRGQDRRGHALRGKSSLFVRVDGCDDVTLRNLSAEKVTSDGPEGAAVGFMLNGCERVVVAHARVKGVEVRHACSDSLSDDRPQSGLLLRRCAHVKVDGYVYSSPGACSGSFRETSNAALTRCDLRAPSTFYKCKHVVME